jgi:transmembrane sensor
MDHGTPQLRDQAAEWVVRLSKDTVEAADWLDFLAWLDAEGDGDVRRAAFDKAQTIWLELNAAALVDSRSAASPSGPARLGAGRRRQSKVWGVGLAAAASIGAFAVVSLRGVSVTPSKPITYATGVGQRRTIRLPDGTRIDLNAESRLTVDYGAGARRVQIQEAEAAFDVVHDPKRPFVITVGDGQVRVLGTAFDLRYYDGETQLSVSRGVVQLSADGRAIRVPQGAAAAHLDGGGLRAIQQNPASALAWRDGRLLYVDQPLSRVVADLNRQFARPIRLGDEPAARLRFTGVIVLGSQSETLRRLTNLTLLKMKIVGSEVVLTSRRS